MSSLTSPLESREARARVAELGEQATCSRGPGLATERLVQLEHEEPNLQEDLVSRELALTSLEEEVLACKRRLEDKEQDLAKLKQETEAVNEETKKEKNQLSSQLICVHLARDALEDEARHLKAEVVKLRGEQEVAQLQVANITQGIEQLISLLATREREVVDLRLRAESLEGEVKRLEGVAEDWGLKAKREEERARELEEELALRQGKMERLDSQALSLKRRLEEEIREVSEQQKHAEELMVNKERKTEKEIEKLREENSRLVRENRQELRELKETGETKRENDVKKLAAAFQLEKQRLEEETDFLRGVVANLRAQGSETFLLAGNSHSRVEGIASSESSLAEARIQELSQLADKLRMQLVVEKRKARESLGKEVSTSSEHLAEEEIGEQKTARESLALDMNGLKGEKEPQEKVTQLRTGARGAEVIRVEKRRGEKRTQATCKLQPQVSTSPSPSTTTASQARAVTPPSASSNDSPQPSLKRPVDLKTDSDNQKKARSNINTEVLGSVTGQGGGSPEVEIDTSMQVEDGEERRQVGSSNQYSGDLPVEEEALSSDLESDCEALTIRNEEVAEVCSSPLQALEHACHGCQSVFTQAASLHHHQAVAGRCKRVKEPEPQEFSCHRCFRLFTSKSHWSRHINYVFNCEAKTHQREGKMVEEAGLIETQRVGEELCLETGAELDSSQEVLTAESPQLLPGLEGKEAPLGDHCYARSGSLAHENRQSSHSSGHPVQVNSGIYLALVYYSCQNGKIIWKMMVDPMLMIV